MASWVLGIDPSGSKNKAGTYANLIGWALFKDGELQGTGELIPDPLTGLTRVRRWLRDKLRMINVQDDRPDITVSCESAYLGPNAAVFQGLIRVKAHIEATVLDLSYLYKEISPMESFVASTGLSQYPLNGNGKRSGTRKPSIRAAVVSRYHLSEDISEHEVDAIAVAEAIVQRQQKERPH